MSCTLVGAFRRSHFAIVSGIASAAIVVILGTQYDRGSKDLPSDFASATDNANLPTSAVGVPPPSASRVFSTPATNAPELGTGLEGRSPQGFTLPEDQMKVLLGESYEDLFSDLRLTPEEADRFLDLVSSEWNWPSAQSNTDRDAILTLLGYERFQRYEAYSATVEQRSVIRGFEQELAVLELEPLGNERKDGLLSVLLEEHSAVPPAKVGPLSERDKHDRVNQLENFEQRVLQRAEFILSHEQWIVLRTRLERSNQQRRQ